MGNQLLVGFSLLIGLTTTVWGLPAEAATLYSEDFSGQNGKGATGGSPTDISGVNWTIELNDAALFNGNDYFRVESEAFVARDTNSGCANVLCLSGGNPNPIFPAWFSEEIDISEYTNLSFSLDAFGSGTNFEHEVDSPIGEKDFFVVSYLLDGVEFVADELITATGSFTDRAVNASVADGSTLQLKISLNTTASPESIGFDNVLIEGDLKALSPPKGTPEPSSVLGLLGLGSVVAIAKRRK
ncbi:MAG: PEP-CTERM sorting domain-containing protein [Cyanobacteriota bacterium]|nr:PEP-CTERM sorting domain-containing protein [Cyanobacteriota bacterium]